MDIILLNGITKEQWEEAKKEWQKKLIEDGLKLGFARIIWLDKIEEEEFNNLLERQSEQRADVDCGCGPDKICLCHAGKA